MDKQTEPFNIQEYQTCELPESKEVREITNSRKQKPRNKQLIKVVPNALDADGDPTPIIARLDAIFFGLGVPIKKSHIRTALKMLGEFYIEYKLRELIDEQINSFDKITDEIISMGAMTPEEVKERREAVINQMKAYLLE